MAVEPVEPEHVTVPPRHESRVEQAGVHEVLDRVQVCGGIRHGEEAAQPLVRRPGFLPQLLLYRRIHVVRPRSSVPALELHLGLGGVDATDLDGTGKTQSPRDQRLPPELLHHGDARVVADAEVDAVVAVRAEAGERIIDARHGVHVVREGPAGAQTPGGVRVTRDGRVHRDAERVPAEAEVLRVAVEGRGGEVVERVDPTADHAQVSAGRDLLERQMHEPGRLAAEDLLHREEVGNVAGQAVPGPIRRRDEGIGVPHADQTSEVEEHAEGDVVGVPRRLRRAADRVPGDLRHVGTRESYAGVAQTAPLTSPPSGERVLLPHRVPLEDAVWVEDAPGGVLVFLRRPQPFRPLRRERGRGAGEHGDEQADP